MINIDKLKSITHLVTHGPTCPDGIASALIVKDALPDVRVSFMNYGTKEHRELEPASGLLFADFTPVRERVQEFVAAGALCLDHHPTARDIVEAFGENGVFGENDKNECGAWLAYEHVWMPLRGVTQGPTDVGHFARLAAIRDTWKRDDPQWEEACRQAAELLFRDFQDMDLRHGRGGGALGSKKTVDERLVEKQLSAAQRSINEAYRFRTSRGTSVQMFQGVSTTSDAAEILEQHGASVDLVVGFHYRVDPTWDVVDFSDQTKTNKLKLQFSTRSHTGYDCAALAKSHPGGGGHKAAAGFTVEVSPELSANPYQTFRLLLEEFEGG